MHHGWIKQLNNGLWLMRMYIENGRLIDIPLTVNQEFCQSFDDTYPLNLDHAIKMPYSLILPESMKKSFEHDLENLVLETGDGKPYSHYEKLSGACVGRNTCRLTYTDSENLNQNY